VSSTDLKPFVFHDVDIRVLILDGEPWFIASDLCAALTLTDTRRSVERVDEADLRQVRIESGGQNRWMYAVNESGMYELVIRSDKPDARKFRRWITSEVLPTLRTTGSYQIVPVQPHDDLAVLEGMIAGIRESRNQIANLNQRQAVLEAKVSASDGEFDEFTALGYAKLNGLSTDRVSCQRHGQRASRLMKLRGQTPRKRQDATFGSVNVYPADVLAETVES